MYSRCDLTKETDKLIALTGIASKIHTRTGQNWCAGIWKDFVCQGLLWLPTNDELSPPSVARAPSWSWASWDGAIQFPLAVRENGFRPRCEFVSLETPDKDQVAWLNGVGSLTLRGRLLAVSSLTYAHTAQLGPGPPRKGDITSGGPDLPLISLRSYVLVHSLYIAQPYELRQAAIGWIAHDRAGHTAFDYLPPGSFMMPMATPGFWGEQSIPHKPAIWFLILGTHESVPERDKHQRYLSSFAPAAPPPEVAFLGIFLESPIGEKSGVYRRIGFGQLSRRFVESEISRTSQVTPRGRRFRGRGGRWSHAVSASSQPSVDSCTKDVDANETHKRRAGRGSQTKWIDDVFAKDLTIVTIV
ncbi:hypothetical protein BU26DRAFT_519345 [Trematosphaeria pertusa]|uniref:Heterokaryon incompatibility domain-containing protein n=1 Tax=Trematosphaeria pertusa TaxID=390896 RepID=A0A6A6IF40_9PLEO|nr:uncharacterized protein BU26DRAFT_519345 [Trematosphaeria pertusa]KAF2249194.1 hypothetical protein BU26DRAFT_519345 [Trematosphaeria pertusa]